MSSSVYVRLKNGRVVPLLSGADRREAEAMKDHLDTWVARGQSLAISNARGQVEDITPRSVGTIEIIEEPLSRPDGNVE